MDQSFELHFLREAIQYPKAHGTRSFRKTIRKHTGADLKEFESVESTLRLAVVPNLNEAAIDLARYHSWITKRRIQKLISQSAELPPEVSQLLDQLKSLPSHVTQTDGKGHG